MFINIQLGQRTDINTEFAFLRQRVGKPVIQSMDDFYVDRDKTPKDADGKLDFECLEALDIDRFNNDMTSLLNGDATELPVFNFKTGNREEKGRMMQPVGKRCLPGRGRTCYHNE